MTNRSTILAATAAAFTAAVAVAVAGPTPATPDDHVLRIAVLADRAATPADIARAEGAARDGTVHITVRRIDGALEARGAAVALAAGGYDVMTAAGPQARAAVSEADAGDLAPATRFVSVR